MRNISVMVMGLVVFFFCLAGLKAQDAKKPVAAPAPPAKTVAPAKTTADVKKPAAAPLEIDESLHRQMRDLQWEQSKNAFQMSSYKEKFDALSNANRELNAEIAGIGAQALKKAGLDPKEWQVNYDTQKFERIPKDDAKK